MAINKEAYVHLLKQLEGKDIKVVAVSKTMPAQDILDLYELGHRDFGENYVQELVDKAAQLPEDIRWHFIGHLQTNKVKYLAPFVSLIHGVDSQKLLNEINKQAAKKERVIDCLLQMHIAEEETKFGLDEAELEFIISQYAHLDLENVRVKGLMGMASFTDDMNKVRKEFRHLRSIFDKYAGRTTEENDFEFTVLSMGMSSDYLIAVEEGSTMLRIGSLIFGARQYEE